MIDLYKARKYGVNLIQVDQDLSAVIEYRKHLYTVKNGKLSASKDAPFKEYLQQLPLYGAKVPRGLYFRNKKPYRTRSVFDEYWTVGNNREMLLDIRESFPPFKLGNT